VVLPKSNFFIFFNGCCRRDSSKDGDLNSEK
jgi:hypothetical protein